MSSSDSSPVVRSPRPYRRPNIKLSSEQEQVLEWVRLSASLQAACQLSNVEFCRALAWVEAGQVNPGGPHGEFVSQMKALGALAPREQREVVFSKASRGGQLPMMNGSSNGNGSHAVREAEVQIVCWDD
jgi:hypothetical protein